MEFDDIVYLSLLIFSILFGYYYRQLNDKNLRKNVGTIVGLLITTIVSGIHIIHPLLITLINALIILCLNKRICHLVSFIFTFSYLAFFRTSNYFGIPYPPAPTNLIQMMLTLKLVGLAFEVNSAYHLKKQQSDNKTEDKEQIKNELNTVDPNFIDIFHYAFNYIGVLTGPYYRYKTFNDSFNLPFSKYCNWKEATIDKLQYVPIYAIAFLVASHYCPLSYASSKEFYESNSWFIRYMYIWPYFFIFRMRIYIGLVLSECVCTMAGLGAYPKLTNPKSGGGPSENFQKIKELSNNPDNKQLKEIEYNFETVHNVNPYGADFCTTYREGMKHWNTCIQYWLAVNVYKRFPNKSLRTFATVLVSAYWHGVYSGYYFCIATVPFVLPLEDVYVKLLLKDKKGTNLKVSQWIMWFFKMHFFSYQAIAFLLLEINKVMYYYNSIYHAGAILGLILYFIGLSLLKTKKRQGKKDERKEEDKINDIKKDI